MADNKNLPIKFFGKREQDGFFTEAGGSSELPSWVQNIAVLEAKCDAFKESLTETAGIIASRSPERAFIPVVISVTIAPVAIAKSHREDIGKVFNRKRENNFIGMADDLEFLVQVEDQAHLDYIFRVFDRPAIHQVGLSAIENIASFKPLVNLPDDASPLKIKLVNYQNSELNESIENAFANTLQQLSVSFRRSIYAEGLTVFRVNWPKVISLDAITSFEALFSITPMPMYSVGMDEVVADAPPSIVYPEADKNYTTVGVLDSGISPIAHLAPWLDKRSYSRYASEEIDSTHGTFVAGVIRYGDILEGTDWVGKDGCMLLDATVFPDYPIDEIELIENISAAVRTFQDVKIWNLSGGAKAECDLHDFSDFARALDSLQEELGILICKSSGNCTNFTKNLPKQRISKSADSLRSLVVGSIAHVQGKYDLASPGHPSPFTRIGFAPNGIIKPDLIHYGGNSGLLPNGRVTQTGVLSFSPSGGLVRNVGTSFSTPRVSALASGMTSRLADDFDPLITKALIIHSAKYPTQVTLDQIARVQQMGYGLPSNVDDIIYNAPYEITLILRDNIEKGTYIDMMDFPYPDNLVDENGLFFGEIVATLVSNPLLDGSQGPEYCQTDVSISLGTYDSIRERDMESRTVRNPIGRNAPHNVLLKSHYQARFRKGYAKAKFSAERQLRDESLKYHPVKKYAVNLSEMTEAHRMRSLPSERKWYLQLKSLVNYATQQALDKEELTQEFCLILSIRDPHQQRDVYSAVTRKLDIFNFAHSNIKLRGNNEINLRS